MVEGWRLGLELAVELLPLLLALGRVNVDGPEARFHRVSRVSRVCVSSVQLFVHVCYIRINLGMCVCVCVLNFMHHIRKGMRGDKRAHAQVSKPAS
jgi:hypothetical protein